LASILSACQRVGKNSITRLISSLTTAQKNIRAGYNDANFASSDIRAVSAQSIQPPFS
jgi:hypothetical protein